VANWLGRFVWGRQPDRAGGGLKVEELLDRIKALEEAGLTQIVVSPPPDGVQDAITEVSRELIGHV
jgi:hypothetical protein